jgi:hypothetical protein
MRAVCLRMAKRIIVFCLVYNRYFISLTLYCLLLMQFYQLELTTTTSNQHCNMNRFLAVALVLGLTSASADTTALRTRRLERKLASDDCCTCSYVPVDGDSAENRRHLMVGANSRGFELKCTCDEYCEARSSGSGSVVSKNGKGGSKASKSSGSGTTSTSKGKGKGSGSGSKGKGGGSKSPSKCKYDSSKVSSLCRYLSCN